MATYSNQHWLLCHIRNSFVSTDDTGMCETVMVSDDLAKNYLRKFATTQQQRGTTKLDEIDFVCYPGLDQSDDEDVDLSTSFDIQMYPEVGAHRFRSNTAQKLEKMDIARRKAARTKNVNYDEEIVAPERSDFFIKKTLPAVAAKTATKLPNESQLDKKNAKEAFTEMRERPVQEEDGRNNDSSGLTSKLALQLANSPKQAQNKFMEFARFDGTSQTGMQTKRINVFLSMLPERERNYPIKICVIASAKIIEVIGLVCYKATIQYDVPLKSIRHYALYMTEDNDDMEDFPPLDNREPCAKFGFSHLTLAERRPLVPVTRIDYNNMTTKSMTSEEDKARLAAAAVRSLQGIKLNGASGEPDINSSAQATASNTEEQLTEYEESMLNHNAMLEAPLYRTFRLHVIDRLFLKTEVTLGISGERIEIDQHKNAKFWTKQKAVTYSIDFIACCEIVEKRHAKATLRIWLRPKSSSTTTGTKCTSVFCAGGGSEGKTASFAAVGGSDANSSVAPHSPTSPDGSSGNEYAHLSTPFAFFNTSKSTASQQQQTQQHAHMRFKHYLFEADALVAEQINKKLNCILQVRCSEVRREFLQLRERKLEKAQAKKKM